MTRLWTAARRLRESQEGQDLMEYALMASLIAVVCVAAITSVGNAVSGVLWTTIAASI
jgi:pilus assembly protein Flp/PilA